jgi:hypothetical protein
LPGVTAFLDLLWIARAPAPFFAGTEEGMLGPTAQLRAEIERLSRMIAQIERKPRSEWRLWFPTLRDLELERQMLAQVVAARRMLALEKVVDLRRWRDPTRKNDTKNKG